MDGQHGEAEAPHKEKRREGRMEAAGGFVFRCGVQGLSPCGQARKADALWLGEFVSHPPRVI